MRSESSRSSVLHADVKSKRRLGYILQFATPRTTDQKSESPTEESKQLKGP